VEAQRDSIAPADAPARVAVEDPAAVQHYGLKQAVLLEVGHEVAELEPVPRHERE
jgi:hypothetical protein